MALFQYLVRLAGPLPEDHPHNTVIVGQYDNGDNSVLIVDARTPTFGTVIGGWRLDGEIKNVVQPDFYELRPLGNDPDGKATKQLEYVYPEGWEQRFLQRAVYDDSVEPQPPLIPAALYPYENDAMAIEVRHKEFTGTWSGWGWRAEIIYVAQQRSPDARAIGIYRDEDASDYHYTTGAFVLQDSDWQLDENQDPLQVWATETPAGFATPDKEPIHHALLLGAAQEGHQTLWPEDFNTEFLYWENDLGASNRVRFIDEFIAQGGVAQPNSWNRVLLRFLGETHYVTWGQIINERLPGSMSPQMVIAVLRAAVRSGLIPPLSVNGNLIE